MHYLRGQMKGMDVLSSRDVEAAADGQRVRVAGAVITRQRPGTGKGFRFVTLEDETGVANLILSPQVFQAHWLVVTHETFLLAEGILQNTDGTTDGTTRTRHRVARLPLTGTHSNCSRSIAIFPDCLYARPCENCGSVRKEEPHGTPRTSPCRRSQNFGYLANCPSRIENHLGRPARPQTLDRGGTGSPRDPLAC